MPTLDELKQKIFALEGERNRISTEVEELRKAAEERAAALQADIDQMREEAKALKELLNHDEEETETKNVSVQPAPVSPAVETQEKKLTALEKEPEAPVSIEESPEEFAAAVQEEPKIASTSDSTLSALSDDERKAVNVLKAHGGKSTQKNIRAEAGLSWLQTSRVISHLVERGLVERVGDTNIQLTNKLT